MGRNEATNEIIEGSKISQITMFESVKTTMINLMMGYPAHIYWGIIEGNFRNKKEGEIVRDILEQHKLIEVNEADVSKKAYRLTSRGVNFAISLANLEHTEKIIEHSKQTLNYSKEMRTFTKIIIAFGILTFIIGINQLMFLILPYTH